MVAQGRGRLGRTKRSRTIGDFVRWRSYDAVRALLKLGSGLAEVKEALASLSSQVLAGLSWGDIRKKRGGRRIGGKEREEREGKRRWEKKKKKKEK